MSALSGIPLPLEEVGEEGRLFRRIIECVMRMRAAGKKIRRDLIPSGEREGHVGLDGVCAVQAGTSASATNASSTGDPSSSSASRPKVSM